MQRKSDELIEERLDSLEGQIVQALFMLHDSGQEHITPSAIAQKLINEFELRERKDNLCRKVGKYLKSLNVRTYPTKLQGKTYRIVKWNANTMNKLKKRYIPDT